MSQNVKAGLFSLVTGNAAVSALIGTQMYPITLPEPPTLPAIRYHVAGGSELPTFDTAGMQQWRFQFDCVAVDADTADALRSALIACLNGYVGVLSDGTRLSARFLGPLEFFDSDPRQYRCAAEFYLNFTFN